MALAHIVIISRAPNFDPKFGYPTRPEISGRVRPITRPDPNLTRN